MDRFVVVVNAEGHHSLWSAGEPVPGGWRPVYGPGSRDDALAYVEAEWKDQTPASVRAWLGASFTPRVEGFAVPADGPRPASWRKMQP